MAVWDAHAGKRIRKCTQHTGTVNSVAMPASQGGHLYASGSDDGAVRVWDVRSKKAVQELHHKYQVRVCAFVRRWDGAADVMWSAFTVIIALTLSLPTNCFPRIPQILAVEMSADASKVFAGGIDNCVQVWDLAKGGAIEGPVDVYEGHADSITGLRLSPDGKFLLSNGMDNTLRQWDVRPFVTGSRQVKVYQGATVRACRGCLRAGVIASWARLSVLTIHHVQTNACPQHGSDRNLLRASWSPDGEMVCAGSSDRAVHVFDVPTTQVHLWDCWVVGMGVYIEVLHRGVDYDSAVVEAPPSFRLGAAN